MGKFSVELASNEQAEGDSALEDADVTKATAEIHFRDSDGRDSSRTYQFIGSVDDVSYKVAKSKQKPEDEDPAVIGVSKGWGPRPLLPDTSNASAELKSKAADEGAKAKADAKKGEAEKPAAKAHPEKSASKA